MSTIPSSLLINKQVQHRTIAMRACTILLMTVSLLCGLSGGLKGQPEKDAVPAWSEIVLAAPVGVTGQFLGRGLTSSFKGFAETGPVPRAFANEFEQVKEDQHRSRFVAILNNACLTAHSESLFTKVNLPVSSGKRYLIYDVFALNRVERLKMHEGVRPAPGAAITPCEVWYGWALSAIICGDEGVFTSDLAAELMQVQGDLRAYAELRGLQVFICACGLMPKRDGELTVARSAEDVRTGFTPVGQARPVFVKYRYLCTVNTEKIQWQKQPLLADGKYELHITELQISKRKENGSAWDVFDGPPDPQVIITVTPANGMPFELARFSETDTYTPSCRALEGRVFEVRGRTKLQFAVYDLDLSDDDYVGRASIDDIRILSNGAADLEVAVPTEGQIQTLKLRIVPVHQ